MTREVFGVTDLFKGTGEDDELDNAKVLLKKGDETIGIVEKKFYAGEEVTIEEFKEAERALEQVERLLNDQVVQHQKAFTSRVEGMPPELMGMVVHSMVHDVTTLIGTLGLKKGILQTIRKKLFPNTEDNKSEGKEE